MSGLPINRPLSLRMTARLLLATGVSALVVATGLGCLILAPLVGPAAFDQLWGVEPLNYIGAVLLIAGLGVGVVVLAATGMARAKYVEPRQNGEEQNDHWRETTLSFFNEFDHDLGRPLRRIAGRQRELRAALRASGSVPDSGVMELLDEIERQAVNYRLMLSNIQVLVESEAPGKPLTMTPVEPAEVVRRIVDRYVPVALEMNKEISWWAEPPDFGMVSSNSHAIEHIVANLMDNAVTHASSHVEVTLSSDDASFFVKVWDDGPGIAGQYLDYVFDRGWTPEAGRREEKTSSGLGLFIARTLACRCGGELTAESVAGTQPGHYTSFLLALPLKGR